MEDRPLTLRNSLVGVAPADRGAASAVVGDRLDDATLVRRRNLGYSESSENSMPSSIHRLAPLLFPLLALLVGCGDRTPDAREGLVELARGFRPTTLASGSWTQALGRDEPLTIRPDEHGSGFWIRTRIRRTDWRRSGVPRNGPRPLPDRALRYAPRRRPRLSPDGRGSQLRERAVE